MNDFDFGSHTMNFTLRQIELNQSATQVLNFSLAQLLPPTFLPISSY